jgi:hypothetical protein
MASLMDWFRRGRSGYAPLPENGDPNGVENPQGHADQHARRRKWTKRAIKTTAVGLMLVMVGYLTVAFM